MRQSLQRAGAFFFLAAATGVLVTSCVDNESSMFIRGCLAFPADSCTVTPDAWRSDYMVVEDITRPDSPAIQRASFTVESGKPGALAS